MPEALPFPTCLPRRRECLAGLFRGLLLPVLSLALSGCLSPSLTSVPPSHDTVGEKLSFPLGVQGFPRTVVSYGGGKAMTLSDLAFLKGQPEDNGRVHFRVQYRKLEEKEFDLVLYLRSSSKAVVIVSQPEETFIYETSAGCGGWTGIPGGYQVEGGKEGLIHCRFAAANGMSYNLSGFSGRAAAFCMPRGWHRSSAFLAITNVEEANYDF